jgi:hypothetical protein
MKRKILVVALFAAAVGCGDEKTVEVTDFEGYGAGHPGQGLVHGGQIFLELIHRPEGDIGMLHGWARDWSNEPAAPDSLPLPPIPAGTCMDISTDVFPRPHSDDATFLDLGPELTVRSVDDGSRIVAPQVMGFVDNLQYRIPMGYQLNPFSPDLIEHNGYYKVDFDGVEDLHVGDLDGDGDEDEPAFYFPPTYSVYEPNVGVEPVTITRGEDLVVTWQPLNQDIGGPAHSPERTFAFVIFVGAPNPNGDGTGGQFKVLCPINDGLGHDTFTVPAEITEILPPGGRMITGQPTHHG